MLFPPTRNPRSLGSNSSSSTSMISSLVKTCTAGANHRWAMIVGMTAEPMTAPIRIVNCRWSMMPAFRPYRDETANEINPGRRSQAENTRPNDSQTDLDDRDRDAEFNRDDGSNQDQGGDNRCRSQVSHVPPRCAGASEMLDSLGDPNSGADAWPEGFPRGRAARRSHWPRASRRDD